jgi:hypothetical protein
MKRHFLKLLAGFVLFSSCSKEVSMCVSGDFKPLTTGPQTYSWCGDNAVEFHWEFDGEQFEGNSVTFNFPVVGIYNFSLEAKGKKERKTEYFSIPVGEKQVHVEPLDCETSWYVSNNGSYRAYLFENRDVFQNDFRSGEFDNCMDSVDLLKDMNYANPNVSSGACWNGRFNDVEVGNYFVYVKDISNTTYLTNAWSSSVVNLIMTPEHQSDLATVYFNLYNSPQENLFLQNLFSKTFYLTGFTLNGTDMGVATCNADDHIIFNLDGTWEFNTGTDDCLGAQTNSTGTLDYGSFCSSIMFNYPFDGQTNFGDFPPYFDLIKISETSFKITYGAGFDQMEQIYTVQ